MTDNTDILNTIQTLRAQLDTLEARLRGKKAVTPLKEEAAPKPKRVKTPAQEAWFAMIKEVQAEMEASGWTHPETGKPVTYKDAMQEASKRKAADPNAPKPKPKAKAKPKEAPASDGEAAEKPKRKPREPLTDDAKEALVARLQAGRKAAAERRKAEKAATEANKDLKVEIPPIPEQEDEGEENLERLSLKGKQYLHDLTTNGCWLRTADGAKGEWAGIYDPKSRTIDTHAEKP